jgi:hypothetical protein
LRSTMRVSSYITRKKIHSLRGTANGVETISTRKQDHKLFGKKGSNFK